MPVSLKHHRTGSNVRCTRRLDTAPPQWAPLQEPAQQPVLAQSEAPQVGQVPPLVLQPPEGQALGLVSLQEAALVLARGLPHKPRRI